jgi:Lipocalin-like domain
MKKTILALCVLGLVFTSCKKDKQNEQVTPTKENLTGTYKMTAATMAYSGASADIFNDDNFTPACHRDDIYHMNAADSYAIEDAGTVCSPSSEDSGNWSLESSSTLNINGEAGTIKSWNGKTLVVEVTDSSSGAPITYSSTYVKQ